MKKIFKFIISIPKFLALLLIGLFKFCISPFIPHSCKFKPTCSIYGSCCFAEWGFFKGLWLTLKRLCKCNMFSKAHGTDPVPINPKRKYKYYM